ncbi:sensor histidine kinase [Leptospira stimsonii]|uniref:histidine kinase n=1 Tax=Leptospira stimsonii TaxID=2202203 RepID=A0ABY2N5G0_9LEPT|nr:sensor histidine kinase [Leptospira stimsonii]TGK19640.1 histidine kinase [Leptospira stimsonii]TGM17152.1 histidine kinase [Leptospira stimsonii]
MKSTIEKNVILGIGVIILLNFVIAGSAFYAMNQSSDLRKWESHTQEVLANLEETLSSFSEMHSSLRSYILYKDAFLLTGYHENKGVLLSRINSLNILTRDNSEQQTRIAELQPLVNEKIDFMEATVLRQKFQPIGNYTKAFHSSKGNVLSEKIRVILKDMKEKELRLYQSRREESETNLKFAIGLIFIAIILNLSFISFQYILIYQESKRRQGAEERLKNTNANLENYSSQLERSNKDLESFSYSVSHDLRAPIRGIAGFSKILMEDHGNILPEDGKRIIEIIIQNAGNMGQLIDDLLEYSRLGRKEILFTSINMKQMAQKVLEEVSNYYPNSKVQTAVGELPSAKADSALLKQLLFNLISNSFKYSREKENPRVEVGSYEHEGETVFFVKDNGAGFDMKYQHKLFNMFQRLHHPEEFEGTGVGLAIVKRVVEKHKGKVWGESKLNEGACFYFTLGVLEDDAQLT